MIRYLLSEFRMTASHITMQHGADLKGDIIMHMADVLVSPAVAGTMYAVSSAAAYISVRELKKEDCAKTVPVMGVMGAFVFAAQMINFTIPGTGSSGHLCGGMLISALAGPFAGFITMITVLLIQCLMFADGGILALGCNIWNMAFYGCFVGCLIIWKPFMKKGFSRWKIIAASIIGCELSLQLGALSVCIETFLSGVTELPFSIFVNTMQPIHLAIGFVEGIITAAILVFIYESRPSLLYGYGQSSVNERVSFRAAILTFLVMTVMISGGLSLAASEYPDGLEWSIEKTAGEYAPEYPDTVYESAENIQNVTAVFPDYGFKDSENALGTSVSGIIGSLVILLVSICCVAAVKLSRKKKEILNT